MPVKFRCQHCKQLLGISRRKAGQVVDCPKCGRSVRVPEEDGMARAAPEPELNLDDPALAKALDELAAIGQQGQSALIHVAPRPGGPPEMDDDDWLEPEPLPAEAVPTADGPAIAELPPKPTPKPIDPPKPVAPPAEVVAATVAVPPPKAVPVLGTSGSLSSELRDLAALAGPKTPAVPPLPPPVMAQPVTNVRVLVALVAAVCLLFGFVLGFATGWLVRPTAPAVAPARSEAPQEPSKEVVQPAPAASFKGRVTYRKGPAGPRRDEGAIVLFLPVDKAGLAQLPATGLRPGDSDLEKRTASALVSALGGAMAIAGPDGEYSVQLPAPGAYHVIALSANSDRGGDPIPAKLRELLTQYVKRPDDLVGSLAVQHAQENFSGTGTVPWDITFESL